jgi:hypothetical protein
VNSGERRSLSQEQLGKVFLGLWVMGVISIVMIFVMTEGDRIVAAMNFAAALFHDAWVW